MKVTLYSPNIFSYFIDIDYPMINFEESLKLDCNIERIAQFGQGPDGGKSGEFFYFTFDNKLIIKTMSDTELLAF